MKKTRTGISLLFLLCTAFPAFSQSEGLFVDLAGHYYLFPPEPFTDPLPGLRLGAGWSWKLGPGSLGAGAESGFTRLGLAEEGGGFFTQTTALSLIPFMIKVEYALYFGRFALRPGLALGGMMIQADSAAFSPSLGPRLYGEYGLWGEQEDGYFLSLFAGAGADFLLERSKAFPLTQIELGLRLRPLAIARAKRIEPEQAEAERREAERVETERREAEAAREAQWAEAQAAREAQWAEAQRIETERREAERIETERAEAEAARIETERREAERIETERVEAEAEAARVEAARIEAERREAERIETERIEAERLAIASAPSPFARIYFNPDAVTPRPEYRAALNTAAAYLAGHPGARLIIKGYCAPIGTTESQREVSRQRAEYCRDYLIQQHRVTAERIAVEWYGGEQRPAGAEGDDLTLRRVAELILVE